MTLLRSVTEPTLVSCGNWRAFRSGRGTLSALEFDRQLKTIVLWIEQWDHQERCAVLDALLACSNLAQTKFLGTVIEPALHRDFMYTARKEFPKQQFVPISTFTSRKMKARLARHRADNYHRINSAHLEWKEELQEIVRDVKLPELRPQAAVSGANCEQNSLLSLPGKPRFYRSVTWGCTIKGEEDSKQRKDAPKTKDDSKQVIPVTHSVPCRKDRMKDAFKVQKRKAKLALKTNPSTLEAQALISWYKDMWDDAQRNEFLQRILLKLDPRQHYYISGLLCIKHFKDFISYLPEKVSLKILSYLSAKELLTASHVCKKWYSLCSNNDLWHRKCNEGNIAVLGSKENRNWKKTYLENNSTRANWDQGKCTVIHCKGHTNRVLCVTFFENLMATGSLDKTILVWELSTGESILTLTGHFRGVWCVKFFTKHLLISGSYDCAIKIWNLREEACIRTLLGHEGPIWAIVQKRSILASGSRDRTARIWDASRCLLLHTLNGHHGAVYCIDMDDEAKMVITGSSDKTVRLWSVSGGEQLRVLYVTDRAAIMAVSYSNGYIACSFGGKITLYKHNPENNKAKVIMSYHEHRESIESLLLLMKPDRFRGTIISGGRDGELKYWSVTREKSIQTYRGHSKTINCAYCDEFRIATASSDNKVKIWDCR